MQTTENGYPLREEVGLTGFMKNLFTKREILQNSNMIINKNDSMISFTGVNELSDSEDLPKTINFLPFFQKKSNNQLNFIAQNKISKIFFIIFHNYIIKAKNEMNSSFQANFSYKSNILKKKMIQLKKKSSLLLESEYLNMILQFCDIITILRIMRTCKNLNKGELKHLLKNSLEIKLDNVSYIKYSNSSQ